MRYTVLIADDSKLQRVIVKENLKDIYDVAEASGGQECLDLVEHSAGKIDAVLLDIVMPGMDGFEVLRRRQESRVFQKIPVIVLTMSDRKEDQELAEQLGADGFLLKPVDAKQARLQISRVLREQGKKYGTENYFNGRPPDRQITCGTLCRLFKAES